MDRSGSGGEFRKMSDELMRQSKFQSRLEEAVGSGRGVKVDIDSFEKALLESGPLSACLARLEALRLRESEECNAFTLGIQLERQRIERQRSVDRPVSRSDLYQIIIEGLPVVTDQVPWADILSFRAEPKSQLQQRALRLWITEMATGKLTFGDAIEKIEALKDDYRAHMRGAGVKTWTGTLKTYVVAGAELLESALKLKLKTMAELPFKLIEAKAELWEAERKAPGRELAYVVSVEDEFR